MSDADPTGNAANHAQTDESGLIAFSTLLAFHRIAVDATQLRHSLGHQQPIEADDLKRLAKRQVGVKARRIRASFEKLQRLPLRFNRARLDGLNAANTLNKKRVVRS